MKLVADWQSHFDSSTLKESAIKMTIIDYLRKIRENEWNSHQLGAEFEWFVKRYFKMEPYYAS